MTGESTTEHPSIVHGSPDGYLRGCRGQGGCVNHGDAALLTCAEAYTASRSDWALSRRPSDHLITKDDLRQKHARSTAQTNTTPSPQKTTPPAPEQKPTVTVAKKPRSKPALGARDVIGEEEAGDSSTTKPRRARAVPARRDDPIAGARAEQATTQPPSAAASEPKQAATGPRPLVHGSVHGHRRGCRTDTDCPNYGTAAPTCTEAHLAYYRDYRARRRSGIGPEPVHGTPSGYATGCHDRAHCPGDEDGVTCADASLAEERRRRREQGTPAAPELTDSAPVREHIAQLREAGMGVLAIAAAAEVGKTAIKMLIYGRDDYADHRKGPRHGQIPERITVTKADRILAVNIPAPTRT